MAGVKQVPGGSPGNRTLNLRIKSPLLCLVELATPTGIVVAHERSVRGGLFGVENARYARVATTKATTPDSKGDRPDLNRRHPGPQPGALTWLSYGRHG